MTRYVIVNAYSARNAGDAAIMLATAQLIRESAGAAEVTIASRYHEEDRAFYAGNGIEVVPPLVPFPLASRSSDGVRALRLGLGIIAAWVALLAFRLHGRSGQGIARRLGLMGLLAAMKSDVVIVAGGGYLYSARRKLNLTLLHANLSVRLAGSANKPRVMMPQSIGPLTSSWDRKMVRWGLSGIAPIVVREELSLAEARSVFGPRRDIVMCPDVAFVTRPSACDAGPGRPEYVAKRRRIGFVPMDWTWARPSGDLEIYIDKLSAVTRQLVARGDQVVLTGHSRMPEQGQDDFEVVRRLFDRVNASGELGDGVVVVATTNLEELQAYFAGVDVVVGTRLHSCILAMTSGTPAVALAYQPKATGTYKLLGLETMCLDVEMFEPPDLLARIAGILDDRVSYRHAVARGVSGARDRIESLYSERLRDSTP